MLVVEAFGSFSDYAKFNMAMSYKEKMNEFRFLDNKARVGAHATLSELWANMLLNVGARSQEEFYNIWIKKQKEYAEVESKEGGQIDKDARRFAEFYMKRWLTSSSEEEFEKSIVPFTWTLHRGDRVYGMKVQQLAKKYIRKSNDFESFIGGIASRYIVLDNEAEKRKIINEVSSSENLDQQQKDNILFMINTEFTNKEMANDILRQVDERNE